MKKVLGIVLSVALVCGSGLPAYKVTTNAMKGSVLKTYTVSAKELDSIAKAQTAKGAAEQVKDLKGNDYEAAVHAVLDKYYTDEDSKKIAQFESAIDSRADGIVADYKEAAKERSQEDELNYEANTSILTFGADVSKNQIKAIVKDSYGKVDYIHECTDGSYLVKVESVGMTANKAAKTYQNYVETNSSEINGKVEQIAEAWDMVNDPYRLNEYYLSNLKVGDAWNYINGKAHSKVKVAIIDGGGIDINANKDLTNVSNKTDSVVFNDDNSRYAMTNLNATFNTSNMHMINGAGLVAAQSNNESQIAGVAAGTDNSIVDLVNVAIPLTVDKIAVGLDYASSVGCKVANLSLFHEGSYDYEEAAVNRFTNNGGTVVAGAGNNGADLNGFPSDYANVISIIATNSDNSRRGTSNYGWECDFCAPGTDIIVPGPGDETWVTNGTSMASPIAAGVVAMMYSVNGSLNKSTVHNILAETAQDLGESGRDYTYAYGLINAGAAVAKAGGDSGQVQTQAQTQAQTQIQTQATTAKTTIDPNTATYKAVPGSSTLSYSEGSSATIVNVQSPGWTEGSYSGAGVYFHVPNGISSIKVNDGAGAHIEGAGGLIYLTALNTGVNKIDVVYAGGETTFYIKKTEEQTQATTTAKLVNDGTELLKNTNFNGADNWNDYSNAGAVFTNNGNGSVNVKVPAYTGGDYWSTQLVQSPITLDPSKYYVATYVATSSAAKKTKLYVQTTDYATTDVNTTTQITAGETKLTKVVFKPTKSASYLFGIMMGYVDGFSSAATDIKIEKVSLKVYNSEAAANSAAGAIETPTQTPTTTAAPTTTAVQTTKQQTTAVQTTKEQTTAVQTTKEQTTVAQTTKEETQATTKPMGPNVDPSITAPFGLVYAGNETFPYHFAWGMITGIDGFNVFVDGNYAGTVTGASIDLKGEMFADGDEHIIAVQTVKGDKVSRATAIKYNKTNNHISGAEVDDNFEVITTTVAQTTTKAATTKAEETTTKAVNVDELDPETLVYKEFTSGNSKIGYCLVKGVTGIVDPVYEDAGKNLTIFYSGDLGTPTSVTINGVEKPDGAFKNAESNVTRLNPSKFTETYNIVKISFENGEQYAAVIKLEEGQEATTINGGDPSEINPSTLDYTDLVSNDDSRYTISYNMIQGVEGSVDPEFTGHGDKFITRFNAGLKATSVTINGAKSSAVSTNDYGVIIVNPFRLAQNSYNVVVATFEDNSQLVYVLRKGDPENATSTQVTTTEAPTKDPFVGDDFFDMKTINYSEKYGRYQINVDSENSYGAVVARGNDDTYHLKIKNYGATEKASGVQVGVEVDGLVPGAKYLIKIPIKADKPGSKIDCAESGGTKNLTGDLQELECILKADSDGRVYVTIGTGAVAADTSVEIFRSVVELKDTITQKQTTTERETTTEAPTTTEEATWELITTKAPETNAPSLKKPGKVSIKKIMKKKKTAKKLTIKIKKLASVKGYQVAIYKTKKNAKKNKKALLKKYVKKNVAKLVINSPKLKNKKVLFVRVRAYRKSEDEVKYGAWSAIKKTK